MKSAHLLGAVIIIIVVLTLFGFAKIASAQYSPQPPTNQFPSQTANNQPYIVNNPASPQATNDQRPTTNDPSSPLINSYAPNLSPDTPQNMQTLTQSVIIELLGATSCMITGINPVNQKGECLAYNYSNGQLSYADSQKTGGGAIGAIGNLVVSTFSKPSSGGEYIAYATNGFGLTRKAYAQTVGFQQLTPILGVWIAFRNLTYLLFVLVLVFIGVGIMLRIQIDPRTVMGIQNQIPKVIIALILITFSYAIAGLLIDLMWISIFLVVRTFATGTAGNQIVSDSIQSMLNDPFRAPFFIASDMFPKGYAELIYWPTLGVGTIIQQVVSDFMQTVGGQAVMVILAGILSPIGGAQAAGTISGFCSFTAMINWNICQQLSAGIGLAVGFLGSILAYIIIGIAVLWAMIRLWFSLVKAYIFILINIIFSPFWILGGLIPGSGGGFGAWLRDLVGNLAAFPVVFGLFALARIIMSSFTLNTNSFITPLIGTPLNAPALGAIIAIGIILIAPEAVTMARETIKAPEFKYTAAIGKALGVGVSAPGRLITTGASGAFTEIGKSGLVKYKDYPFANTLRTLGIIR